jgi:asparagine synthase (glutamine-hydrolysing)
LHFYMSEMNFSDAFNLKRRVYADPMRALAPENPFRPTAIGPRSFDQIPAAVIRMLFDTWLVSNAISLGDRVSMGVGVEARLPFLDVRLIERVMALRAKVPDHRLGQKAWLRAALKGVLPDEVLTRPKAGFQPPVRQWLSGVIEKYGDILRNGALVQQGIIGKQIDEVIRQFLQQGWPGLFFAYKLVLLEFWYQSVAAEAAIGSQLDGPLRRDPGPQRGAHHRCGDPTNCAA